MQLCSAPDYSRSALAAAAALARVYAAGEMTIAFWQIRLEGRYSSLIIAYSSRVMTSRLPSLLSRRTALFYTPPVVSTCSRPQLREYASAPTGKTAQTSPRRPGGQGDRLRIFPLIFIFCAATGTYVLMVRQRAKQAEENTNRFKPSAAASRKL